MIKNVIFDIGNVLTHFEWENFLKSFHYSDEITKRIAKASVKDYVWNQYDLGLMEENEILENFINNDKQLEKEIRNTYRSLHGIVTRADYAIPWIKELKEKGYQVYYLSNFSRKALNDCSDALDFLPETDGGILSFMEHLIKPMPEIYQLLISRYQLKPDECVFLDDLCDNVNAADKLGINTILFKSFIQAKEDLQALLNKEGIHKDINAL